MARKLLGLIATIFALAVASGACAAEGGAWSVSKSSGEVWITSANVQQASLKPSDNLKPGDTIRTGRNGRVLLMRGEETILIAPNSIIGHADGAQGRAVDHHHSAGRLDPARGRKAQRQAFRGRDAVFRRRGERHPVPRLASTRATPASMCSGAWSRWRISSRASLRWCCRASARPRSNMARPVFH